LATLQTKSSQFMQPLSFKNRIAFYNLISAAMLILIVFGIIYFIVSLSVNRDINSDLALEIKYHQQYVSKQKGQNLLLVEPGEWGEVEHNEIEINPIFVQIFDAKGKFFQKSPNLKEENLKFGLVNEELHFEDTYLAGIPIRQVQAPLLNNGKTMGYAVIAMSVEEPVRVLYNLKVVLFITFPIVIFALFFTTRFIAGRSIKPALSIISTTSRITNSNLSERINLPRNKDELFILSSSINQLLDRIENAVLRERKFTSDASHELRTPLAVIQGTLEVLIRKTRESSEYEDKIKFCISEVNRLNDLADQLLLLARFENQKAAISAERIAVDEIILQILERYSSRITAKNIAVSFDFKEHFWIHSDGYLTSVVLENLLSNAVKYSRQDGKIVITLTEEPGTTSCTIIDTGIGISTENLQQIYNEFYRVENLEQNAPKGTGLGLSIVKRLCELLQATLKIESVIEKGTTAIVTFNKQ